MRWTRMVTSRSVSWSSAGGWTWIPWQMPMKRCPSTPMHHHGAREIVPVVNRIFEWAVALATFLTVWGIVPRHCARLTDSLHPKLRKIHAALVTPRLITLPLRAGGIPNAALSILPQLSLNFGPLCR